jgi:hypothetical protein
MAMIILYCSNCEQLVEQKANLSIVAPGTFGVEIDACSCGSKTFNIVLMNGAQELTPRYEIDNYTA